MLYFYRQGKNLNSREVMILEWILLMFHCQSLNGGREDVIVFLETVTHGQAPLEMVKVSLKSWLQARFL